MQLRDNLNKHNSNFFEEKNLNSMKKNYKTPVIVGFDPGVNVGIAILDLNGKLIFLNSYKLISKSEIIYIIMKHGKAVLIATDVSQIPKMVKKLASSLNSKIFSPKNDIQVSYKNKIVDDYLNSNKNLKFEYFEKNNKNIISIGEDLLSINFDAHGRDSLFAAILAFKNYENKFNQLEKKFFESKDNILETKGNYLETRENNFDAKNNLLEVKGNFSEVKDYFLETKDNLLEVKDNFLETKDNIIESKNNSNSYFNSKVNSNIINQNYYYDYFIEKLDQAKTLLINEVPISIAIDSVLNDEFIHETANIDNLNDIDDIIHEKNKDNQINNLDDNFSENLDYLDDDEINKIKNIIKSQENKIKNQEKRIKNQDKLIKNLNSKNKELNKKIKENDIEISKLKNEIKDLNEKHSKNLLKEKTIASKVQLLKTIQKKYIEEKELRKSLEDKLNLRVSWNDFSKSDNVTPIKIVDFFTREGINRASNLFDIKKDDVLLLDSSEGGGTQTAKMLVDLDIKAILINGIIPQQAEDVFEEENIPIILAKGLNIKFFDDFAVIKTKILENEIKKWKEKQRNNLKKKAQKELLGVIGDYQAKRKRSME